MEFKPGNLYRLKSEVWFYCWEKKKELFLGPGTILLFLRTVTPFKHIQDVYVCHEFFYDNELIIENLESYTEEPEKYFEEIEIT